MNANTNLNTLMNQAVLEMPVELDDLKTAGGVRNYITAPVAKDTAPEERTKIWEARAARIIEKLQHTSGEEQIAVLSQDYNVQQLAHNGQARAVWDMVQNMIHPVRARILGARESLFACLNHIGADEILSAVKEMDERYINEITKDGDPDALDNGRNKVLLTRAADGWFPAQGK